MSAPHAAAPQCRGAPSHAASPDQTRCALETRLAALLPDPANPDDLLTEAMQHAVLGAGTRLRPMLFLSMVRDLGHDAPALLDLAGAIEIVHAASSILHDLPCMDDAKLRCGQAVVHGKYGQDIAMLAAVALLSHAFDIVACVEGVPADARIRLTSVLAQAVAAQGLAKDRCQDVPPAYARPAADIGVAIEMAAAVAQTGAATTQCLRQFAYAAGQAFQNRDDLRDASAGPAAADGGIDEAAQAYVHLDAALGPHNQTRRLLAAYFPHGDARSVPPRVND